MRASMMITGLATAVPGAANAHASEQGFVLLLPTDIYITAGVASVALTVVLLAFLPGPTAAALFRALPLWSARRARLRHVSSCASALLVLALVAAGLYGSRDPLVNPLPLTVWTVWWIGLVTLQGLIFDHWRWSNPWTGPGVVLSRITGERAPFHYPRWLGHGPGIAGFLAFAAFLMADPAPTDPARLATVVGGYWLFSLGGLALFGPRWLLRAEALTMLMRAYRRMAVIGRTNGRISAGLPGWQVLAAPPVTPGLALFVLLLLGSGSFDGLNETFWWLGVLGLNPLEFPGRSAVVGPNILGLVAANTALVAVFALSIVAGLRIAGSQLALVPAFALFAPSILPIALGYHIAHYLTAALVEGQYVAAALNDPLNTGADLLGIGHVHVTTGFLNTPGPVRAIWLSQAGAVVIGHIIAILLAHALALRAFGSNLRAVLSQAPLAAFMVAYTFFGLWLLASPRGL